MKKKGLITNVKKENLNNTYWAEDVNGIAIGHIDFEDLPHCGDLVFLDYSQGGRFFVIYSEDEDINNDLIFLEEISEQEFINYASEWEGVNTHIALGDWDYIGVDDEC